MTLPKDRPLAYLITTGHATDRDFVRTSSDVIASVTIAVKNGVSMVQLREKQLSGANLYRLAGELSEIIRDSGCQLFINDRADVAIAVGAHGVHLTSSSLPVKVVRAAFGTKLSIGLSTHSVQDISGAIESGADFAVIGPVFATPGKDLLIGLDGLRSASDAFKGFPVIALGGVNEANFRETIDAGAAGFAAIRSLNDLESMKRIMLSVRPDLKV